MPRKKLAAVIAPLALLLLSQALAIDVSPYDQLVSDLSSKESALEKALADEDWEEVVTLNQQLDSINSRLASPQMVFLRKYAPFKAAFDESEYLMSKMVETLPPDSIASAKAQLDSARSDLSRLESSYGSGNYSEALARLQDAGSRLASMPETLASAAAKATDDLKNQVQRTSTVTPSMLSMIDSAKKNMISAQQTYRKAIEKVISSDKTGSKSLLDSGHVYASEAFNLLTRSRLEKGDDLSSIKFVLVLTPLALVLFLLAYFYLMFNKSSLKCIVSKNSIRAGTEDEIERRIEIANTSKAKVSMTLVDAPPKELHPHDFSIEPTRVSSEGIIWNLTLSQGEKATLSYKLKSESLEKGAKLVFPTATLSYETEAGQRRVVDKPFDIDVSD